MPRSTRPSRKRPQRSTAEDFTGAMAALASLRKPIDEFFDHVTVNDPDPAKRERRLNLLMRFRDAVNALRTSRGSRANISVMPDLIRHPPSSLCMKKRSGTQIQGRGDDYAKWTFVPLAALDRRRSQAVALAPFLLCSSVSWRCLSCSRCRA